MLRQYQSIYNESLGEMPDVNHLIAINTRYIGEAALAAGDEEALSLAVKFFNTYLRATLNASHVRTAYNVLNQYRQLAERALELTQTALVGDIAFFFKYYAQIAHTMELGFVTETVAYDLATLCERAFGMQAPSHDAMLEAAARGRQGGGEPDAGAHAARRAQGAGQAGQFYLVAASSDPRGRCATRGRSSRT